MLHLHHTAFDQFDHHWNDFGLVNIAIKPRKLIIENRVNMVEMGQIKDFVQILGLKTPISAFLDHLTLEDTGTPKLFNVIIFYIIPKKIGQ